MTEYVFNSKMVSSGGFNSRLEYLEYLLNRFMRNADKFNDIWDEYNIDDEHDGNYPYAESARADMNRYRVLINREMKELCEYAYGRIKK